MELILNNGQRFSDNPEISVRTAPASIDPPFELRGQAADPVPHFGSSAGQGNAAAISLYADDPAQDLVCLNGLVAAEGGITP